MPTVFAAARGRLWSSASIFSSTESMWLSGSATVYCHLREAQDRRYVPLSDNPSEFRVETVKHREESTQTPSTHTHSKLIAPNQGSKPCHLRLGGEPLDERAQTLPARRINRKIDSIRHLTAKKRICPAEWISTQSLVQSSDYVPNGMAAETEALRYLLHRGARIPSYFCQNSLLNG